MLTAKQRRELIGLGLLAVAAFLALSLVPVRMLGDAATDWFPSGNLVGPLGAGLDALATDALGVGRFLLPLLPALAGAAGFERFDRGPAIRWALLTAGMILLVPIAAGLGAGVAGPGADATGPGGDAVLTLGGPDRTPSAGGWLGDALAAPLASVLGWFGAALLLVFVATALCVATVGWNPGRALVSGAKGVVGGVRAGAGRLRAAVESALADWREKRADAAVAVATPAEAGPRGAAPVAEPEDGGGVLDRVLPGRGGKKGKGPGKGRGGEPVLADPGDPESSDRPPLGLLSEPPPGDSVFSRTQLDRLGEVLLETLQTFKVEGRIEGRTTGPVVTQFEFVPAPGIKVNRVAALDADLALALKAPSVRIVAPIPGKGAVGVEVPNPEPETVHLREILESPAFRRTRGKLPLALGKDLEGRPYVADLARMPHLLIAGATGSGKSVCINTLITSLIYRFPPQELRMLLVDPKMVELSMYKELPHLRHSVVTDPSDAATVLKWAVFEMERRYELLRENGARSLIEFNRRVEEGQPLRSPEPDGPEDDPDRWLYKNGKLPYIVVIIDELADLMMAVQAEIEKPLAQLAQKARAIGIHLIVATQRPSVNVITGLIKANFPSRIAFRVSAKVDSRTIIDQNGADALLGNGDMLFLPPGHADPIRIQGAFIATEETERLMRWYRERDEAAASIETETDILDVVRAKEAEEVENVAEEVLEDRDELFRQAAEVCIQHEQGSTSLLQRRLRIGYGRAARIVDQLQHAGVVGPPDGSKPREVLVGLDQLDVICGE